MSAIHRKSEWIQGFARGSCSHARRQLSAMVGTFSPIPSFKLLQPVQGHDLALGAVNKLQGGYDGFSGYAVAVGEAVTDAVHDRILS